MGHNVHTTFYEAGRADGTLMIGWIDKFFVFCSGDPLKNPVQLSALKSEFDELQECFDNTAANFYLYTTISAKLTREQNESCVDVTTGTIDLANTDDEITTIKETPLRYKSDHFYIDKNYKVQLTDFENYKITNFNPRTSTTESGTIHIIDYIGTEEVDRSVHDAISRINVDSQKVLDLNIYKIDLLFLVPHARNVTAYYNKDSNAVTITSPLKVLISDRIPLLGETLPDPILKHGLVYDIDSKSFKDGHGLHNPKHLATIPVFKLRPYPFCEEKQQAVSKFWEKDRRLKISNILLNNQAIHAVNVGGTSLIQFDKNILVTLKCNWMRTTCNLHGRFSIDGDDVHDIVSDKNHKLSYKLSWFGKQRGLLESQQVFLHPLNQNEINKISDLKTEKKIEYIRISELKQMLLQAYDYFEAACRNPQPAFHLQHILNYRSINMEYKCESGFFEIVKEPSLSVALYNEDTLTETLSINDLEYNIRYSPKSDVFTTRTIVNGIYGFTVEDRIEFRDKDVASDLLEMALFFDEIRMSHSLSNYEKNYCTLAVTRIGTEDIFVAQLNEPEDISKSENPTELRHHNRRTRMTVRSVMLVHGKFSRKFLNKDDETFTTFYHDGNGFLSTDARGNLMQVIPAEYIKDTRPIRIRLAKQSLLGTRRERNIKKEIFYARVRDLQKIVKYIKPKLDHNHCKIDRFGTFNMDISMREDKTFIVEGKYSCLFGYLSIEIRPNTKIFTKDGKGVVLSELVKVVFTYDFVSITTRYNDIKDIYAFRVKEYSDERAQTISQPNDKKDICIDRIDGSKYSCFVKRDI